MSFFGGKIGVYSPPRPIISSENSQNCLKILPYIRAFYSMSKCQKILIQSKVMAISNLAVRHQKWSLYMGTPTIVWPTAWSLFVQKFKTKLFWGLYMVKIQPQKPGLESRFWLKRTWSPTVEVEVVPLKRLMPFKYAFYYPHLKKNDEFYCILDDSHKEK